ncbi:MAG: purine-nucleoside/S-methyl-5-thioadenosine phosphorylase / adenosine deaminase [Thermoleophilaceae bacterium]|nr:purine-nucleoside/S-methyl-5-thioadenosine phosphorylase / adenosine deaminase [Thermoleophilaceae bacterium]
MIDKVELPGAQAVFSTRRGGVSEGPYESLNVGFLTDDEPDRVVENRGRLAREAGVGADDVVMGWQVHGTDVRVWDGPDPQAAYGQPGDKELPRVDGHLTAVPGVALLVLVADCYPVALSDGKRAAMLHCGWRPLAGGILEKAVAEFDSPPAAAVGPGISGCCYEVGPEVAERFADIPGAVDGRMLDLRRVISARLSMAGVSEVAHLDRCTSCEPDLYFSHRRDRGLTGRQAALCVLTG